MANLDDTFKRSCDHWSESSRGEMEDFYSLASVDYQHLAKAINWNKWLQNRSKKASTQYLQLLDVACGSGKFPAALISHAGITDASLEKIDYALLDPSSFSISEARQALSSPFIPGEEYEMKLQELKCDSETFDIVWATHGLYAIPQNELELSLQRMIHAIGTSGSGFIAHASTNSHYLQFFKLYLSGFKDGVGTPYSSSEQIIKILTKFGAPIEVKEINYTNIAPQVNEQQVERYLQRCLFDDSISLNEMLKNPVTGPYLKTCYQNNIWQFKQYVSMIFINNPNELVNL